MSSSPGGASANPLPLGYACLAISVLALSYAVIAPADTASTAATLLFVGGLGMLIAGLIAFSRGSTLEATWLVAYGMMWGATAFYFMFLASKSANPTANIAWWAVAWGIFTALVCIVSYRAKRPIASLTLLLFFITFLCIWIANQFGVASFNSIASIAALITAILAAIEGYLQLSQSA
jgi:succinate-acetate transporter protein